MDANNVPKADGRRATTTPPRPRASFDLRLPVLWPHPAFILRVDLLGAGPHRLAILKPLRAGKIRIGEALRFGQFGLQG